MNGIHALAALGALLCLGASLAPAETINPWPRQLIRSDTLHTWTFDQGVEGWNPTHDCSIAARKGVLAIRSTGGDPYLLGPLFRLPTPVAVRLRIKCESAGGGQIFWQTVQSPRWSEKQSSRFKLLHDGQWHEVDVPLEARGTLRQIRLDPGSAPGRIEVDSIAIIRSSWHPIEIQQVESTDRLVVAHIRNHSDKPIECSVGPKTVAIPANGTVRVSLAAEGTAPFDAVAVVVKARGLPPVQRTVFLHRPDRQAKWLTLRSATLTIRVAPDGSGARVERDGKTVAIIAPLVHRDGAVPKLAKASDDGSLVLAGSGTRVALTLSGDELRVRIDSDEPCEGPVVRALGSLEQGLLAGLEYLGKGERSSSKLDIETPEHIRFAPDPLKVTMPLMACVTERGAAAVTWDDMSLQPVFAAPNFFDGTADHRMALRGRKIEAVVLARAASLEEAILWAAKRRGLPPLPKPPRTREQQWELCMTCLNGPVKGEGGWGHCAGKRWGRQPYAAFASTIWRITGDAPRLAKLSGGGSHVGNDAIYFIQSRAKEWLAMRRGQARGLMTAQRPDGSWRYKGKFLRGHFEDTASGFCAQRAFPLLDYAWATGDREAIAAGVKALDYMKRFRTPRGAQTWELSLHTPDVLASAYLVWAYVRGYQLTGNEEYLALARKWALSGVPFVYQWTRHPIMLYASPPVFGATHWRAPNWMGLPVQWCAGVYAYALGLLAPHDKTLDWAKLARGILISAEQQQYPDGQFAGCLPDVFDLGSQTRRPANINPCALVSLRLLLDGEVDSLAVATDGKHRVVAPFPVEIRDGKAIVRAKKGIAYEVLVDGRRIIDVDSKGTDVLPLE